MEVQCLIMSFNIGQQLNDARRYGWTFSKEGTTSVCPFYFKITYIFTYLLTLYIILLVSHAWTQMVEAIQNYIRSLNWSYRSKLRNKGVKYINGLAKFFEPHTLLVILILWCIIVVQYTLILCSILIRKVKNI